MLSLKEFNTFGLSAYAKRLDIAESAESLLALWQKAKSEKQPVLLLGGGSNVLFTANFEGTVILNRIMGIQQRETDESWHLHVGAGENWHELVCHSLKNQIYGLENLALIPGCSGAAPIQNIGAYGIEFRDVCEYVDVLNLETGEQTRLSVGECQFRYRDSVFKHKYKANYSIISVGLLLKKNWQPILNYGDLTRLSKDNVTPQQIFDSVCAMRTSKLPDPAITGNAGSFFKNPIVSVEVAAKIKENYPDSPQYLYTNGMFKLAAAWLIERCNLKGYRIGGASVHLRQALVLINQENATGKDVVLLAAYIRRQVISKFGVLLEPEVRFIGSKGEIDAVECIS
ncbi:MULTISPECIES: UDP-N-acetylmuramate dehydrogenase [Photorhabdus]|uniref:UDP-N-acetylenolpyruvoylglucosamine reductase n=2 Tax=Photorhabdus TaxID=29487 RepID=A0ABX0B3P0_9GAMM|nr:MULTISPECIES: UDP-N-acetylmuramate dehydrogenase [Photorhabdus]MCC8375091.1 UDP-N-acetylmuramate dehydrogenase [Photorhabdus bodei]MCC8465160.1 UDP-N-acetylmuramate dehydrogenase [Photorhabdus bodei]MCT8353922.1 UDP-N-acetylmuramate dehydrogenase [Photorhabdus kayaii]MDB6370354.1 UDP-N-acetylmuramate dehydrogenase [Photorhabdus bodei]MDB6374837.1 UDP-N-acetylmuramate dehydrogenase [Photorhabdus bodei]